MAAEQLPVVPVVKLGGSELGPDLASALRSLQVHLVLAASARARITFDAPGYEVFDDLAIEAGDDAEILLARGAVRTAVFKGLVSLLGVVQDEAGATPQVVIEAHDRRARLEHRSNPRTFVEMRPDEVISRIASENGLTAKVPTADAAEPWLVQVGTDLAMVDEMAARLGAEWWIDDRDLIVERSPDAGPIAVEMGKDLRRFSAGYASDAVVQKVTVRGWNAEEQTSISEDHALGRDAKVADVGADAGFLAQAYQPAASERHVSFASRPVRDASEAGTRAEAIARRYARAGLHAEGELDADPKVRPGSLLRISKVGSQLSGTYRVVEVEHEFGRSDGFVTRFRCGDDGTDGALPGPRTADAEAWGRAGVVPAIVTNTNDPEGLGRIKVRFRDLDEQVESDWARVVSIGGGKERGLDLRPSINDEVLVAFEHGDPRFAVVLGGLPSRRNLPSYPDAHGDGTAETWSIVSPGGHRLVLMQADSDADQRVELSLSGDDGRLQIRRDGVLLEAPGGQDIELRAGSASITLRSNGDIVLAGKDVTVDATGNVTVKGTKVEATANAGLKLRSQGQAEFGGIAVKVEASGIAELKGSMVKVN